MGLCRRHDLLLTVTDCWSFQRDFKNRTTPITYKYICTLDCNTKATARATPVEHFADNSQTRSMHY